jgi:NitT/TauT family transport system ATP-binding protein
MTASTLTARALVLGEGSALVQQATFTVPAGGRAALVANDFAAASLVLRCAAGLLRPHSGELLLDGRAAGAPGPGRVVVWRDPGQLLPWKTALGNVAFALARTGADARAARAWLERLGAAHVLGRLPRDLTAAQAARVALARAFAGKPRLLLLEEPFAALDPQERESLEDALLSLQAETGVTLLLATRDPFEAVRVAERIVVLAGRPARAYEPIEAGPASAPLALQEIRSLLRAHGGGA